MPFPSVVRFPNQTWRSRQPRPRSPLKEVIGYLDSISDPEQAADLVSCAVLAGAEDRQTILETLDVEARLRQLAQFLLRDIQTHPKRKRRSDEKPRRR